MSPCRQQQSPHAHSVVSGLQQLVSGPQNEPQRAAVSMGSDSQIGGSPETQATSDRETRRATRYVYTFIPYLTEPESARFIGAGR